MTEFKKPVKAAVFVMCLFAAGCVAQYRNHGYIPNDEDLANVVVGVDTKDSVLETLGSPSAGGVLDDSGMYYVQSRVRSYGPFRPQEIEREVVAVTFDSRGTVANVERFGLEDGRVVALSRRITDNGLGDISFLKQLLGGFGNFDPGGLI